MSLQCGSFGEFEPQLPVPRGERDDARRGERPQAPVVGAVDRDPRHEGDAQQPTHKDVLKASAAAANRPVEIEVYNADHGWTVPDSPVYNQAEADRAWERLLNLYKTNL